MRDKKQYIVQIRNLKQELNHGLVLKEIHKKAWLKPYIVINTGLRRKAKDDCEGDIHRRRPTVRWEEGGFGN